MQYRTDLAREYAKRHLGKRITKKDLAQAIWPRSKEPYINLNNLERGKTKTLTLEQIDAVIRLTGIPIQMFIQ
jgi:hypothetical protein